ncbi:MAG: serine--tRNA ligase [Oscillospiraceae bacterium]|nr:serine--tRNA ligase [Oscillospiraceae bacterium]
MIDYKLILSDKQYVKRELEKKGYDIEYIDALYTLLTEIRRQKTRLNELNHQRNCSSTDDSFTADEKRRLRKFIINTQKDLKALENHTNRHLLDVPNFPDPQAPIGLNAHCNVILYESDNHYICQTANPLPHWDIAESLGIMDTQAASKISGSGFSLLRGMGAKLLRALVNYGLSLNEPKYTEILPPHLVSTEALTFTGHLPKFAGEQYKCEKDDLWLIPTAEVPMTAAFAGETFSPGTLPKRYMGYTLAFRRESGASGRDTRGLQRIHEFHKVELLKIVEPKDVQSELSSLLKDCESVIKNLGLKYRLVDLCTGEMGDKYARCYDIEVYSPGVKKWLEVSSVGHFSDYQARRAQIKYVDVHGKKKFAYTMNGSGIATPRVWLSIIETYQQPDGSVRIPDVLIPFMGCDVISSEL